MSLKFYMNEHTECHNNQPTSPWTETFRFYAAESAQPQQATETMPGRSFESDSQSPTHEALSAIYNREY